MCTHLPRDHRLEAGTWAGRLREKFADANGTVGRSLSLEAEGTGRWTLHRVLPRADGGDRLLQIRPCRSHRLQSDRAYECMRVKPICCRPAGWTAGKKSCGGGEDRRTKNERTNIEWVLVLRETRKRASRGARRRPRERRVPSPGFWKLPPVAFVASADCANRAVRS